MTGGNKYRNLTVQVVGVSKIETIKYLRPEKDCADDAQQQL
jgi:hypothetical protein